MSPMRIRKVNIKSSNPLFCRNCNMESKEYSDGAIF
jgi:hypothetical protein